MHGHKCNTAGRGLCREEVVKERQPGQAHGRGPPRPLAHVMDGSDGWGWDGNDGRGRAWVMGWDGMAWDGMGLSRGVGEGGAEGRGRRAGDEHFGRGGNCTRRFDGQMRGRVSNRCRAGEATATGTDRARSRANW